MSLIDPTPLNLNDVPTAQAYYKQIMQTAFSWQFNQLVLNYNQMYNVIWNNQYLTPQQVCDAFGTDAGKIFAVADAIQSALNTAQPGTITLAPPKTITINNDGTVTLS